MEPRLPTDDDTDHLFDQVALFLQKRFDYSTDEAIELVHEYYSKFRDPTFCQPIHVPVQDDDFFHHQGAGDMALRAHYYLRLKEDPDPHKYHRWRADYYRKLNQRTKNTTS